MKTVAVDIRPMCEEQWGGISWFTHYLVEGLVNKAQQGKLRLVLFYNQRKLLYSHIVTLLKKWKAVPNVYVAGYRMPNKLLNLSMHFLRYPRLDDLLTIKQYNNITIDKIDYFIAPNLNFLALTPKTKLITICHDLSWEIFPEFFTLKQRLWHNLINPKRFFGDSQHIVAVSQNTKQDLINVYQIPEEKITVIYPGIDHLHFRPQRDEQRFMRVIQKYHLPYRFILTVGTLEPRKNIETLIESFAYLNPSDMHLVVVGKEGWKYDRIYRFWIASSAYKNIQFVNNVSSSDLPAFYALAHAFVLPSFYEGFGLPVLEAMACGTPVVTSHGSSLPEIAADAALFIDPYNIADIARAIDTVLSDSSLRDTLKQKGIERAKRFTWRRTADEFFTLLTGQLTLPL